ncbi:hypothetical protein [Hathewaya limosa]|uniref:Uncharacterized protein n=1 Tax=Hathewaya limosa TaxID=1536 RepID=A0ABU0JP03_HATLI|nr:hypothetical protein [Hathewaya limosa]MDQ0478769.1 hypothetical protein [Hathewaya limosa]
MAFYVTAFLIGIMFTFLFMGFYKFIKKQYNNTFVNILLSEKLMELLSKKNIGKEQHNKITILLIIKIILLSLFSIMFLYKFKSNDIALKYILVVLIFMIQFIFNELVLKVCYSDENRY